MKIVRILLAFALAAGIAGTASAQEAFTLHGEIAGMDGKKMYLMYFAIEDLENELLNLWKKYFAYSFSSILVLF